MTVLSLSIYSSLIAYFCCQENCRHLISYLVLLVNIGSQKYRKLCLPKHLHQF